MGWGTGPRGLGRDALCQRRGGGCEKDPKEKSVRKVVVPETAKDGVALQLLPVHIIPASSGHPTAAHRTPALLRLRLRPRHRLRPCCSAGIRDVVVVGYFAPVSPLTSLSLLGSRGSERDHLASPELSLPAGVARGGWVRGDQFRYGKI